MRIILIGFMGAGKGTIGQLLANELGYKFIDIDEEIERVEGTKVNEIFELNGENYFRKIESKVLDKLQYSTNVVIAAGGGTPCNEINIAMIKNNFVSIYLSADVKNLTTRILNDNKVRPLLHSEVNLENMISNLMEKRIKYYVQASLVVDTNFDSLHVIVQNILTLLKNGKE